MTSIISVPVVAAGVGFIAGNMGREASIMNGLAFAAILGVASHALMLVGAAYGMVGVATATCATIGALTVSFNSRSTVDAIGGFIFGGIVGGAVGCAGCIALTYVASGISSFAASSKLVGYTFVNGQFIPIFSYS